LLLVRALHKCTKAEGMMCELKQKRCSDWPEFNARAQIVELPGIEPGSLDPVIGLLRA
jgi:hypothetical protein